MRKRSSPPSATRLALLLLLAAPAGTAHATEPSAAPAAMSALQPTLLDVTLNGQPSEEPLMLLQDGSGGFYVSAAQLRTWRIRIPDAAPTAYEGESWYRVGDIPGLTAAHDPAEGTLTLVADPTLFERQTSALHAAEDFTMTPAGTGGFVNYDLFAEYSRGAASLNGAVEIGAFTRHGVASTGLIFRAGHGPERVTRLDTSWTIDRPASLSSIRIGDSVTAVGPGASPLRFGGLQYARNFAVRPGFVTMPLPVLEGSAAIPSVVDVYVDNALQGSQQVAPGPFELTNIPVQSGGGTVRLVTRDLLGRTVVTEQAYYASSVLLRRGLHDFSYEVGFVRHGFGQRSNDYGRAIASTFHRYGVTDNLTVEGQLQVSEDHQLVGGGANLGLFDLATVGAAATASRSDRGTGLFAAAFAERRTAGLSFGLRAEYTTSDYAFIGMGEGNRPARLSLQAFADMPIGGGSVGASLIHRDRRDGEDESLANLFANVRLSDRANLQLFARHAVAGRRQTVFGAFLAVPLGGGRSAAASAEATRSGDISGTVSFQQAPPAGTGNGYRATANFADGRVNADAAFTHNAGPASFTAQVSHAGGNTGVRASASGAIGFLGTRPFASRTLGASFAEVRVGDFEGVRVYVDNQLVGVTGKDGRVVVPSLRAFERNTIRIDEADLPLDAQLSTAEITLRPFARTGAVVTFDARRERGVLLQVRLENGTPLPAGAMVRVVGAEGEWVTASGGEVYVPLTTNEANLEARWGNRTCTFQVVVPDGNDPQPRITNLICTAPIIYAAR